MIKGAAPPSARTPGEKNRPLSISSTATASAANTLIHISQRTTVAGFAIDEGASRQQHHHQQEHAADEIDHQLSPICRVISSAAPPVRLP